MIHLDYMYEGKDIAEKKINMIQLTTNGRGLCILSIISSLLLCLRNKKNKIKYQS